MELQQEEAESTAIGCRREAWWVGKAMHFLFQDFPNPKIWLTESSVQMHHRRLYTSW